MTATMTLIPQEEQSATMLGITQSMQDQPEAGFLLLCPSGERVALPQPLAKMLLAAAKALTHKNTVTVIVRSSWLTTQEAADMLGYSRQVVVDLIKKDKLKATTHDGTTHRRIKLSDLTEYMQREDAERQEAMARLVEHTEEFGGYEQENDQE